MTGKFEGIKAVRWTPELKEHAIALALEGHSASQIADGLFQKFGVRKTRNAVIGAMFRAGKPLHGRESAKSKSRRAMENRVRSRLARKPAVRPVSKQKAALYAIFVDGTPLPEHAGDLLIPPAERKTLQQLTAVSCRWPIGDPREADFGFCPKEKISGLPYCEHHSRRAFQPPQPPSRLPYVVSRAHVPDHGKILKQFEELEPA